MALAPPRSLSSLSPTIALCWPRTKDSWHRACSACGVIPCEKALQCARAPGYVTLPMRHLRHATSPGVLPRLALDHGQKTKGLEAVRPCRAPRKVSKTTCHGQDPALINILMNVWITQYFHPHIHACMEIVGVLTPRGAKLSAGIRMSLMGREEDCMRAAQCAPNHPKYTRLRQDNPSSHAWSPPPM